MKRNTIKIITLMVILMIVFSFRLCAQGKILAVDPDKEQLDEIL
ncbi:MAG: hypothetical protein RLZZ429_1516 [Bacteroidota bacterium]|jgi:hypothetical protein